QPRTIPVSLGEAPGRTREISQAVSRIRAEITDKIAGDSYPESAGQAMQWLVDELKLSQYAAEQIVEYLAVSKIALGVMPTQETLVAERFFDESGSQQLVIHSPFGSRLNRAWGLALRKRFCRQFNFELQAAATEDAIILSLGPTHSFQLEEVFKYLRSATVRPLLIQALLAAPMFEVRWRWNAMRALAILRRRGSKKIPAQLQRMEAQDLLGAVFPDQVACAENLPGGDIEIPDHPLVNQTVRDCLEEAMDISGLEGLLRSIEKGERKLVARDVLEPSPLSQEILNARPYAFLDDAPLEERRTRAVQQRRWLDPETASDLGALDLAAIERVRDEVWPDVANHDELHDALMEIGFLTDAEGRGHRIEAGKDENQNLAPLVSPETSAPEDWSPYLNELAASGRATILTANESEARIWIAAERLPQFRALFPTAKLNPMISPPPVLDVRWDEDLALVEIIRGRLEAAGPVTAERLGLWLGLKAASIEGALVRLEAEGFVMRGRFTPGVTDVEWCARRLLARIHSYTLNRLRQEIEPVSA